MSVKIDYRELEELQKRIQRSIDQSDEILKRAIDNIANRMLRLIVKATPTGVGTPDPGNLKRNWKMGEVNKVNGGYEVEIFNPTEYAHYVEYGHRIVSKGTTIGWVKGKFMMTASEKTVTKEIDRIVKKEIDKYFMEILG